MISSYKQLATTKRQRVERVAMQKEIWKTIFEFPTYAVSSLGRVRNERTGRILKPLDDRRGYLRVDLGRGNHRKVHRLVAEAFCEHPEGKNVVNHINRDRCDCRAVNLEWVTYSENTLHWLKLSTENLFVDDEDALPY